MTLMNKVEYIVVGTVKDVSVTKTTLPAKTQITLEDVGVERAEKVITMYGEYFPTIGERVAVNTQSGWIYAEELIKIVDAVADLIDKLEISDENQCRMVNMVLRHQMDWIGEQRRNKDLS